MICRPCLTLTKEGSVPSWPLLRTEVQRNLLMPFRMLLSPQHAQKLRPVVLHEQRPRDLCVTWKTEREHLCWIAVARFPVMNRYRALAALDGGAAGYATTIVITLQNFLTVTAEVGFILPLQRVAGLT